MWVFIALGAYLLLSAAIFLILNAGKDRAPVFKMPKSAFLYYLLSFTWGLPMTFLGCLTALVLLIAKKRPVRCGRNVCFYLPKIDFGLSLGIFIIAPEEYDAGLLMHEHGHGIQNIYLGPFMPTVVALPSLLRFWARELYEKKTKNKPRKPYDAAWFEKSATNSGGRFFKDAGRLPPRPPQRP